MNLDFVHTQKELLNVQLKMILRCTVERQFYKTNTSIHKVFEILQSGIEIQ